MAEWENDPVAVQDWQADPLASESWKSDPIDTGRTAKRKSMQKEMADLQTEGLADEITSKIIEGTEGVVGKLAYPAHAILELPEHIARLGGVEPASSSVPALSQEKALKAVEFMTPGGAASEGTTGQAVQELAAGFISGATTPAMVGGLLAGTKAPVAIGRVFQAEMLGHVPASVAAVVQAEPGQAKTAAALELGVNVALPALIEKGISKSTPKQIIETRAAEVGPATEAVVKGKEVVSTPPAPTTPLETATSELVKPAEVAQPIPAEPSLPVTTTEKPLTQGALRVDEEAIRAKVVSEMVTTEIRDQFQREGTWIAPGGKMVRDPVGLKVSDAVVDRIWKDTINRTGPTLGYSLGDLIGLDNPLFTSHPSLRNLKVDVDLVSNQAGGAFAITVNRDNKGFIKIRVPVKPVVKGGKTDLVYRTTKVTGKALGEGKYQINDAPASELLTRILQHEIEHAIQKELGLPEGGSSLDYFLDTGAKYSEDEAGTKGYDYYKRLAGESLARLSEIRGKMTSTERASEMPWETLDRMLREEGLLKPGQTAEDVLVVKMEGKIISQERLAVERQARIQEVIARRKAEFEQRLATALKQSEAAPVERVTELRAPFEVMTFDEFSVSRGVSPTIPINKGSKAVEGWLKQRDQLRTEYYGSASPELVGMGAATPAEYVQTPQTATGIKNRTVDVERARRDLPPAMEAGRQSFGEAWERAMGRMDKDTEYQRRLIAELGDKPRAVTDIEDATLLHRQIDLQNEYGKATRAMAQAFDDGRMEDVAHEQVRVSELSDQLHELYTINQAVGTETGRGLAARKMMAYEDFSLAKMEVERRAAKGGEGLTPEERAEVVTLQQKIETTQKAYDAYVSKTQQQITALEMKAALAATTQKAQETISPKIKAIAERLVNNLEREADAAWKRIQERGLTFGSGPLHELPNIKDFAIIGASKAVKAGVDYAQWSVSMARQFGEGIKPHLERIWDESQKMLNSLEEMRPFAQEAPKRRKQDPQAAKLHFEQAKAKKEWQEKLIEERRKALPALQKAFGMTGEVLNTTRAVMTSVDLSAVLRQGGFITLAHPIRAAQSFPAMLRAFQSEAKAHAENLKIVSRSNYPKYHQAKLYLAEHGHSLSKMEEAYMSRWAEKIPLVAGSQRAYATFLNKLRADSFDAMEATMSLTGKATPDEAVAIANFINVATGRGGLGKAQNAAVGLNTVFFAPRYVASRFQLLAGSPMWKGTARTRTAIAKEYARYLMGVGVIYGLGKLAGAEVETDNRSSDFGKLRFGGTRIDPLSGLQQIAVLESRLVSGKTKRLSGKVVPIRGEKVPFGSPDASDVLKQFVRTKLSPVVGAGVDVVTGENVVGEPVTPGSVAQNLTVPLAMRDIYEAMLEQGVPAGTAMALLSIMGMGVQTYEK